MGTFVGKANPKRRIRILPRNRSRAADYGIDLMLLVITVALCVFLVGMGLGFRIG